jgi:primase-polymerase (primpol)-like protein
MKQYEKIPKILKELPQWVNWKAELRDGEDKATKVPYDPKTIGTVRAKTNDSSTWGTFEQASKSMKRHGFDGVGFVVTKDDDFVGFDLDKCVDKETGKIEEWAKNIVATIDSYTERSPSKTGIRVIAKGVLPKGPRRKGGFEIYDSGRYFTITGDHLGGTPLSIEPRQNEIDRIYTEYLCQQNQIAAKSPDEKDPNPQTGKPSAAGYSSPSPSYNDDEILNRAIQSKYGEKFKRLFEGDHSGYPSHSEGDLALCRAFAFFGARDSSQIDDLFRKSKLFRPKWDERRSADGKTYGQLTITKALTESKTETSSPKKRSVLDILGEFELFHDFSNTAWITFALGDHHETTELHSSVFVDWLRYRHITEFGKPIGGSALKNLLSTLTAKAQFESPEYQLNIRIAKHKGRIYIDLCNKKREVIRISKRSWKISASDKCPVKFRRTAGMLPLPHPERGGDLNDLKKVIKLADKPNFILVVAWLIGAYNPEGPYPILLITGQHGSTKTSAAQALRNLVDPSKANTRSFPKKEHDLIISANNSWVLAFDNVSAVTEWQSDAMCRLATGSGFATRKLYEDDVEVIFSSKRPIVFNGIEPLVYGHDLIDRCIMVELLPVTEDERKAERKLKRRFKKLQPKLLGVLCDALSAALRNMKDTKIKRLPRMADFAVWVSAAESALPWKEGKFLKCYRNNISQATEKSLESDIVATAVKDMIDSRTKWKGTATELLKELEDFVIENVSQSKMWPKTANHLARRIKMAAPFLKKQGVKVGFLRKSDKRIIRIKKTKKDQEE